MPEFSIVIPVYNVAPYLRECLDSVLVQAYTDWEAICVDDGSTDGSGAILDEYAAKDSRFRVIHQLNRGVSAARNAALELAQKGWFAFIDADDVWHPDFLSGVVSDMEKYPACKLFRQGVRQYRDGDVCDFGDGAAEFHMKDISRVLSFEDFGGHYFCQHIYHRDVVQSIRFPAYRRGEDRIFLGVILLNLCDKIAVAAAPRYGYRVRQGSAMSSVPSVPVIIDEMRHRLDLTWMIENGEKRVVGIKGCWIEKYFTDQFGAIISRKPLAQRKELWAEWLKCVYQMKNVSWLSTQTRLIFRICCKFPCRPVWWLLVRLYPWYMCHGLLPRGIRKIRRLVS